MRSFGKRREKSIASMKGGKHMHKVDLSYQQFPMHVIFDEF
jgi:hypothetical protein